jgi:hypothetical protein
LAVSQIPEKGSGKPIVVAEPESLCSQNASALPEVRWLDAQGAQVNVALAAMVNLVVDGVLDGGDARPLPLAEGLVDLGESMLRNERKLLL